MLKEISIELYNNPKIAVITVLLIIGVFTGIGVWIVKKVGSNKNEM